MDDKPKVLITGINGYLGGHVAKRALDCSKYRIRGSVRNKNYRFMKKALLNAFDYRYKDIEIVELKLLDKKSIRDAVKGSVHIFFLHQIFSS